jgi:small neutral amino acid transporter SnatA (MarC family)
MWAAGLGTVMIGALVLCYVGGITSAFASSTALLPIIVPIAIPLIAGPAGMAAVMLMGSQEPDRLGAWSLALMIAWVATAVIQMSATILYKLLGARALTAVERLMGMLLVAISVQMFLDGIGAYLGIASTA